MKKVLCGLLVLGLLAGCSSGVSQEEYDRVVSERDELQSHVSASNSDADTDTDTNAKNDIESLNDFLIAETKEVNIGSFGITVNEFIDSVNGKLKHQAQSIELRPAEYFAKDNNAASMIDENYYFQFALRRGTNEISSIAIKITGIEDADVSGNIPMLMNVIVQTIDQNTSVLDAGDVFTELLENTYAKQMRAHGMNKNGIRYYLELILNEDESGFMLLMFPESPTSTSNSDEAESESSQKKSLPEPQAPFVYEGSGDDVVQIDAHEGYPVMLYIKGNATGNHFAVKGYDQSDKSTELFVNTTDPYEGITFDASGATISLEIKANGNWLIESRDPYSARMVNGTGEIVGYGDEVFFLLGTVATKAQISGNPHGSHFAVKGYGARSHLLVNTTEPYDGTVKIPQGVAILEVKAVGEWKITIE